MSNKTFPVHYNVQGDSLTVDENLHHSLNVLAGRFYRLHGYTPIEGHDYAESEHPQERLMYQLALEAAHMQQSTGDLD